MLWALLSFSNLLELNCKRTAGEGMLWFIQFPVFEPFYFSVESARRSWSYITLPTNAQYCPTSEVIHSSFRLVESKYLEANLFPRQILLKLTSTWESIPHRQYQQSMWNTMLPSAVWIVIGPRLECLYTEFLLHKLLISQNEGQS